MDNELAIAWVDLTFTAQSSLLNKEKTILNNISGGFDFGSINALMGSSGCGKTTLLKCLGGLNKSGLGKDTKIYLNSEEKIRTCFIYQDQNERLHKGLTVRQSLNYASKLKNSNENVIVDHKNSINELMSELMISNVAENFVENCSGGELKRLSIALELTSYKKPSLLFIDEPTTGLDSNAAEVVIECLKSYSRNHKISIITSIHQPNNDLFMMFDNIYVLAKEGVCVYSGLPQDLKTHLTACHIKCTELQVPIEVLLIVSSKGFNEQEVKQLSYKTSQLKELLITRCNRETNLTPNGIELKTKNFNLKDFYYLLLRAIIYNYGYQWKVLISPLIVYLFTAMLLPKFFNEKISEIDGCFSFNSSSNMTCKERDEQRYILEQNQYFHFNSVITILFIQLAITTFISSVELRIFSTEHRNRWYSTGSYYWSKTIVELLPIIVYSFCYSFTLFYMSGNVNENDRLYKYIYILTAGLLCTQSLGSLVGIISSKNSKLAILIATVIFAILFFLANFFLLRKDMKTFGQILSDYSYGQYMFNSILILLYGFGRCPSDQISKVLYEYDVNDDQIFWNNSKYILYYLLVLRALGFVTLMFKANKSSVSNWMRKLSQSKKNDVLNDNSEDVNRKLSVDNRINLDECNDDVIVNDLNISEILPDRNLLVAWIDLSFTIPSTLFRKENKILDNISGCIEMGSLNALMGPSGSGKTTLLRCLNGKNNFGLSEETKFYLSSKKRIRKCFISQNQSEHLHRGLTARQTLIYASKLKNSEAQLKVDHENMINDLMSELMITNTADTYIENCSGGEQKRIAIASELTSFIKPNLLFVDEPTSGLDSNAANIVIQCLKNLSHHHKMSIIASIHQPSNDLFVIFDNICVLAKGGVCVYSGLPQDLKTHLHECDIECNQNQVPIEVLLKVCSKDIIDENANQLSHKTSQTKQSLIERCNNETFLSPNGIRFRSKRFHLIDFQYLLLRTMTSTFISQWKSIIIQIILYQVLGFWITYLYAKDISKPDGCVDIYSILDEGCEETAEKIEEESILKQNIKFNTAMVVLLCFLQVASNTMNFGLDVKNFFSEHQNVWYSTGAYYFAKSTVDMIPIILTFIPFLWITNFYDSIFIYFGYLYFMILGLLCAQSYGHLMGIIFHENQVIAMLSSLAIYVSIGMLSNLLIPIKELHYSLQLLGELSFLKIVFESLMIIIYGLNRCDSGSFSGVLYQFNIDDKDIWANSRNLLICFIVLKLLSLIALMIRVNLFNKRQLARDRQIITQKSSELTIIDTRIDV